MELVEVLDKIGLDQKQAATYLALLELGSASVYSVARKSGLKRPTVYRILDELQQKGLISQIPRVKKVLYTAESPEKLVGELHRKTEIVKRYLPQFLAIFNTQKEKPQVQLFEGKDGVRQVYQKIYQSPEMWFFGDIKDVLKVYPEGFEQFLKMIKEKNVRVKELLVKTPPNLEYAQKAKAAKATEIRFLSQAVNFSVTDVGIFSDNVVFFAFRPQIFAVLVTSKEISGSIKTMYEYAWAAAEGYEKTMEHDRHSL